MHTAPDLQLTLVGSRDNVKKLKVLYELSCRLNSIDDNLQ